MASKADYGYVLSPRSNASARAINALLAEGATVHWLGADEGDYPAGSIVVERVNVRPELLTRLADSLGLTFRGLPRAPQAKQYTLQRPRIGLYKSWMANMDEGWTRWLLDQYAFDYDTLHDDDIRTRDLAQYDAIILPGPEPAPACCTATQFRLCRRPTPGGWGWKERWPWKPTSLTEGRWLPLIRPATLPLSSLACPSGTW